MKTIKAKNKEVYYQIDITDRKVTLQGKSGMAMGYLVNEDDKHYILLIDSGVKAYSKTDWVKIGWDH